nr:AzlC family ABC transporter permease [Acidaminococcus intestini]
MTATLPIAAGFLFIGAAYGFYMQRMGFSFWYPMLMAMIIFGGSLEFVTVTMLLSPFAPLQAFLMALMIQARHLFYGIAMLDRYKGMGWKKTGFFVKFWGAKVSMHSWRGHALNTVRVLFRCVC